MYAQPQLQQIAQQQAGAVQSDQQLQQRLKQQALMQQALMQQHQSLYHAGLMAPLSQIEPIPSGNLPPGFDSSACRSV